MIELNEAYSALQQTKNIYKQAPPSSMDLIIMPSVSCLDGLSKKITLPSTSYMTAWRYPHDTQSTHKQPVKEDIKPSENNQISL